MYSPTENPLSAYRRFRAQTAFIEHILYLLQTAGVWLLRGWFRRFPPVLLSSDAVNELFTIFLYLAAFLLPYLVYAHMVRFPYREIPHDPPYPPVLFACTGVALGVSLAGSILTAMVASVFALFGLFSPPIPMHLPEAYRDLRLPAGDSARVSGGICKSRHHTRVPSQVWGSVGSCGFCRALCPAPPQYDPDSARVPDGPGAGLLCRENPFALDWDIHPSYE